MHFKLPLVFVVLLPLIAHCQQTSNSKTFLDSGSYAVYPPWVVNSDGLLKLSFITSESDGLLLYMDDGFSNGDYFRARLLNGTLSVDLLGRTLHTISQPVVKVLGEHLNDNRLHNVSIEQDRSNNRFVIALDSLDPVLLSYSSFGISSTDTSSLFVGGVPNTLLPAASSVIDDPHFVGCVVDIQYSNTSTLIDQLEYNVPIVENNLRGDCVDPCMGVSCGSGVCVARWPTGFCDCRGTNMLGESCAEGEPS